MSEQLPKTDANYLDDDANFEMANERGVIRNIVIGLCLNYNAPLWFGAFILRIMNSNNWRTIKGRKAGYNEFVDLFWAFWNKPLQNAANGGKLETWEKRVLDWRYNHDKR